MSIPVPGDALFAQRRPHTRDYLKLISIPEMPPGRSPFDPGFDRWPYVRVTSLGACVTNQRPSEVTIRGMNAMGYRGLAISTIARMPEIIVMSDGRCRPGVQEFPYVRE
jgi:hypothetical protein